MTDPDVFYQSKKEYFRANDPHYLRRIGSGLFTTTLILEGLYIGLYETPVMLENYRLSETEPVLHHVSATPNNLPAETVIMGGFGVRDSTPIAEALPQFGDIGAVDAIEQDNEGIDSHVIAQKIIKDAKTNGLTEIGLWGSSVGGLILSDVAREIQQDDSLLRVRFIVYDCTPTGIDTLQPSKRQGIEVLQNVSAVLPNITSHPIVEYLYAEQQLNERPVAHGGHLGVGTVMDTIYGGDQPSLKLLASEALEVVNPSLARDLGAVGNVKNKQPPLIISIRPKSDTGDNTVLSSLATEELKKIAQDSGLPFMSIKLDGISHGDPTANRAQYQEALTKIILPSLETYEKYIQTRIYTIDSIR